MEATKVCSKCKQEKIIEKFPYRIDQQRYRTICKSCRKNYDSQYAIKNQDKRKIQNKKYRTENKSLCAKLRKNWMRLKYKNDPLYRLLSINRSRSQNFIKNKTFSSTELFCCTTIEVKIHLEKQFRDGMTWENRGKIWHVDHIIPLQWFKDNDLMDETNIKIANHWGNLQPLLVQENLLKSDNLPKNVNFIY